MTETRYRRFDAASLALLLLWAGMALGFGILVAPLLFKVLPSRDLAGQIAGRAVARLDWAAWVAFGGAFACSFLPRWLDEVKEHSPVGPFRLWTAAALLALLTTFASAAIFTPKVNEIRERMGAPVEQVAPDHPDRLAYTKAHGLSRQFFFLRVILALGLASGLAWLPTRKVDAPAGEPEEA
ncbi:MAG: DUF4149 domain-containing protein [Acidobacteria bacterium]|nr:DUF4149 domain-containing protein [Acidobacteriota bacterium]